MHAPNTGSNQNSVTIEASCFRVKKRPAVQTVAAHSKSGSSGKHQPSPPHLPFPTAHVKFQERRYKNNTAIDHYH